jgi:hypothetical protein
VGGVNEMSSSVDGHFVPAGMPLNLDGSHAVSDFQFEFH